MNRYIYALGNSLRYIDPMGLASCRPGEYECSIQAPRNCRYVNCYAGGGTINVPPQFNNPNSGNVSELEPPRPDNNCNQDLLDFGNFLRDVAFQSQQISGASTAVGAGAVLVTVVSGGTSSPITAPTASGAFSLAQLSGATGLVLDGIGGVVQSIATGSSTPIIIVATDYATGRILGRFIPSSDLASGIAGVFGSPATHIECGQ